VIRGYKCDCIHPLLRGPIGQELCIPPEDVTEKDARRVNDRIMLSGPNINGEVLSNLVQFVPDIQRLYLSNMTVAVELACLHQLPRLKGLSLYRVDVTDVAIQILSQMHQLRWLSVSYTGMTEEAVELLSETLPKSCEVYGP